MMRQGKSYFLGFTVLYLLLSLPHMVAAEEPESTVERYGWVLSGVDCPKSFAGMSDRSMVVDSSGNPHVAYGSDHLYYARYNGSRWILETVDSSQDVGGYASLALDTSGRPHISYSGTRSDSLNYAHWTGNSWIIETVSVAGTNENIGNDSAIALDNQGYPYIAYGQGSYYNSYVKVAHWTGIAWSIETVASSASPLTSISCAVASNNRLHISYYDTNQFVKEVYHVTWTGTTWQKTLVEISGVGHTSLALDSLNNPHIVYCKNTDLVRYAVWTGSSWSIQTVDSGSGSTSLKLDAAGIPHIGYVSNNALKYATKSGSTWVKTIIDNPGQAGNNNSLSLGPGGQPSISYQDETNKSLKISRKSGTTWTISSIDEGSASADVGTYTSLTLDVTGKPHISYKDNGSGYLKYAFWTGTAWIIQTIDMSFNTGNYTSIKIDSSGQPHIAYEAEGYQYLKYAHWTGSKWEFTVVDDGSNGDAGWYISLALDSQNRPHISYVAHGSDDVLWYAHWTGSQWLKELVDTVHEGRSTSIALDQFDRPHISYRSWTDSKLMYASWTGSQWSIEEVDIQVGVGTSLAIDSNDRPRIAYINSAFNYLRYASWNGSSWDLETAVTLGNGLPYPALTLDNAGVPLITYVVYDGTNDPDLKLAKRTAKGWETETVDNGLGVGTFSSITCNRQNGALLISYYDSICGDLRLATTPGAITVPALSRAAGSLLILVLSIMVIATTLPKQ